MSDRNWDAGPLSLKTQGARLAAGGQAGGFDCSLPTLLVLDDPEPSVQVIGQVIQWLSRRRHGAPVRILLLAREPTGPAADAAVRPAEWWTRLDDATSGYLNGRRRLLIRLNAGQLSLESRKGQFAAAAKAFAGPGSIMPGATTVGRPALRSSAVDPHGRAARLPFGQAPVDPPDLAADFESRPGALGGLVAVRLRTGATGRADGRAHRAHRAGPGRTAGIAGGRARGRPGVPGCGRLLGA